MSFDLRTAADSALDRLVVPGYTRIGPAVRRRWWPADPEPGSLKGRRVVVTGATSGIGAAAAGGFARLGATVHLVGRNPEKVKGEAERLRAVHPDTAVVEEVCDLADLDAVRTWCDDLLGRVDDSSGLAGLVHNAGAMPPERTESPQGHETTYALHVLGPHLATNLLLPALTRGSGSVVWMSSGGMYTAPLQTDDPEFTDGYDAGRAYARTKRMQVVLARAWAEVLEAADSPVRVESMHPGWVATQGVADSLPRFDKLLGPLLREPAAGADTAVWLVATRPESGATSHFWHDRRPRPTAFGRVRDPAAEQVRKFLARVERDAGASVGT